MSTGVGRHGQFQTDTCQRKILRIFQVSEDKPFLKHIAVPSYFSR